MNHRFLSIGCYLAAIVALADQGSKWWVFSKLSYAQPTIEITSFLNFVWSWNKGITFGMFNKEMPWLSYIFIGAAIIILLFLLNWLMRATSLLSALGLGLVMGGAIGNVIDRLRFGAVADFIDFHYMGYHWYAFNLADSAIVCGVCLLMLENLVSAMKRR